MLAAVVAARGRRLRCRSRVVSSRDGRDPRRHLRYAGVSRDRRRPGRPPRRRLVADHVGADRRRLRPSPPARPRRSTTARPDPSAAEPDEPARDGRSLVGTVDDSLAQQSPGVARAHGRRLSRRRLRRGGGLGARGSAGSVRPRGAPDDRSPATSPPPRRRADMQLVRRRLARPRARDTPRTPPSAPTSPAFAAALVKALPNVRRT